LVKVEKIKHVKGSAKIPGDKSITHRAFIFSSISHGESYIKNPNMGLDTERTLKIMSEVGARISVENGEVKVSGVGLKDIKEPDNVLDAGNSGTTTRLLSGLFSSVNNKTFFLTGDDSLRRRPMKRVIEPITLMGGFIIGRDNGKYLPLAIVGKELRGITYNMEIPSAQVKSAIMLATLNANSQSTIYEKLKTRDHTEIMLKEFGGKIEVYGNKITVYPVEKLYGRKIFIPGDFSSAAYLIAIAMLLEDSELILKDVGLNPTRTYLIDVFRRSGGNIEIINKRKVNGENVGDILVKSSILSKIEITKDEAPLLIDELPLIGAIGPLVKGGVHVVGATELRVKESDRIKLIVDNLKNIGVEAYEYKDGFIVKEGTVKGGIIKTAFDHRIGLSFAVLGSVCKGDLYIEEIDSIKVSFPEFFEILRSVSYG